MDAAGPMYGTRRVVFSAILFVVVLAVSILTAVVALDMHPMIFLLVGAIGTAMLAAASLELLGRDAHLFGTMSAVLGALLALWFLLPFDGHPLALVGAAGWAPVVVLWAALAYTRRGSSTGQNTGLLLALTALAALVNLVVMRTLPPAALIIMAAVVGVAAVAVLSELRGRPASQVGMAAATVGVLLGIWAFYTSPTFDPTMLLAPISWLPVVALWAVRVHTRSKQQPPPSSHP